MAKKKKKTKDEEEIKGLSELKKLWGARPARQWLALFQEIAPDRQWTLQSEHTIKGRCPYHQDNTPSMFLSFTKKYGKCFGCNKFINDLVSLVAKLKQCSYVESLLFLQSYFGLNEELGDNADKLAVYHKYQEMKKHSAIAMREVVNEFIRDNPSHLQYLKPGYIHLVKARQLNPVNLNSMPIGLYAKPEHLKKYIPEKYHEVFEEYFNEKVQGPNYWGAVAFHYNDSPGTISRFKLRLIDRQALKRAEELDPTLESTPPEIARSLLSHEDFIMIKDKYAKNMGVFGLHKYQHLLGKQTDPNVYVTEGEFDVLSVMNAQEDNGSFDFVLVSTSGTGSLDVGFLRDYGMRTIWLVQDHPSKNGDVYACSFLKEKGNFVRPGSSVPFSIKIFRWPILLAGQDLDEAIRQNGYDSVRESLFAERNHTFLNSNVWIIEKCDEQIKSIKTKLDETLGNIEEDIGEVLESDSEGDGDKHSEEKNAAHVASQNARDDSRRQIHETILNWFQYIHDPTERLAFAQKYNMQEGIDITQDSRVHTAVYAMDTREGILKKIKDALKDSFEFAFYERTGKSYIIYVWSKTAEELVPLPFNENAVPAVISQFVGQEHIGWIENLIKDSPFWELKGEYPMADEMQRSKIAGHWLKTAINDMRGECPNYARLIKVGQGVHHFGLPPSVKNKGIVYVVNGNKVFKGQINRETEMIEWKFLNTCVDENIIFDLNPSKEWSFIKDVSDLYAASKVDLKSVYNRIREMLSGWKFDNHELTCQYLASHIMSLPISAAIGNVNILYVTGESESGKTSLIGGLLGGTKNQSHDIKPILESSEFYTDLTPAAMYQYFDRSSMSLIYDEAEVSESHNTAHDQRTSEIQRLILSLPQGGVSFARGGQTSDSRVDYYIRMPVIMAGINLPADRVFLSRVLIVYTRKEYGHRSLADYITEFFTDQQIEELRKDISIGLLPHIPELIRIRRNIKQRLAVTKEGALISDRFLDNILTPLLVYEYAGIGTVEDLFRGLYIKNKDRLEAIHGTEDTSDLVNACLYNEAIKITQEDGMTDYVNARSLILNGEINVLNNAACGVYYYVEKDWIILVWRQAKYTVLKHSPYGKQNEQSLKERVAKVKFVVPEIEMSEHKKIQYHLGLSDIQTPAAYTVINASYLGMNDQQSGGNVEEEFKTAGEDSIYNAVPVFDDDMSSQSQPSKNEEQEVSETIEDSLDDLDGGIEDDIDLDV